MLKRSAIKESQGKKTIRKRWIMKRRIDSMKREPMVKKNRLYNCGQRAKPQKDSEQIIC